MEQNQLTVSLLDLAGVGRTVTVRGLDIPVMGSFNEADDDIVARITPEAIREAVANPRDLDMQLVDAQETRRIVDRLYGYPVSEVLWKKIGREARSAGRVQSVAVRLVVDRERERIAFRSAGYWDIEGVFEPEAFDDTRRSLDSGKREGRQRWLKQRQRKGRQQSTKNW